MSASVVCDAIPLGFLFVCVTDSASADVPVGVIFCVAVGVTFCVLVGSPAF